jgi:hypothetical protein
LANVTYDVVENYLFDIMTTDWMTVDSKLILVGGIMVNVDGDDAHDHFMPKRFNVVNKPAN